MQPYDDDQLSPFNAPVTTLPAPYPVQVREVPDVYPMRDETREERLISPGRAGLVGLLADYSNYFLSGGRAQLQGLGPRMAIEAKRYNQQQKNKLQPKIMQVGDRLIRVDQVTGQAEVLQDFSKPRFLTGPGGAVLRETPDGGVEQLIAGRPQAPFGSAQGGYYQLAEDGSAQQIVPGMLQPEDAPELKIVSDGAGNTYQYNPRTGQHIPFGEGATPDDTSFADANTLRDDFSRDARQYQAVLDSYAQAQQLATAYAGRPEGMTQKQHDQNQASADQSLIFSYMKTLDPGSVVREGEYASTANATGVPDLVRNMYNRALKGERLTDEQRRALMTSMSKLAETAGARLNDLRASYTARASKFNIDPADVFTDFSGDTNATYESWMNPTPASPELQLNPNVDPDADLGDLGLNLNPLGRPR